MASQLQANDSQYWRRSVPGFGLPGVTSWNGRTGDVIGTLANIYSFGQGDLPTVDNRFTGPGFAWTFPLADVGGNTYATGAFEANVNSDQTYWNYVRRAGDHTINTSRTFNLWSINDPTWDGSAGSLAPVQSWITDDVRYGADTTEPIVSQAQLGVGSYEWRDGGVLFFDAANASSSFSQQPGVKRLARRHYLWNQAVGAPQFVDSADGYGNRITTSVVGINGLVPVDIAQVRYTLGSLNPDDGFGYFLATGFLEDLNGTESKAYWAVRSVAGGSSDGVWYNEFGVSKGPVPGNMVPWLRGYTDVGAKVMVGGLQLPSVDSTTFPVSDAGTARLGWDADLMISSDGAAYHPVAVSYISPKLDLTTVGSVVAVPARPGFVFQCMRIDVLVTDVAGSGPTAVTVQAFSGANPICPTNTTAPGNTTQFAKGASTGFTVVTQSNATPMLAGQPITINVNVASTGTGLTWKAVYTLTGNWVPLP